MIDNFIVYQFQLLLWEGNNKALCQLVSYMNLWLRAAVKRENQPCYYHVMITIVSRVAYILGLYHHFKWICRVGYIYPYSPGMFHCYREKAVG